MSSSNQQPQQTSSTAAEQPDAELNKKESGMLYLIRHAFDFNEEKLASPLRKTAFLNEFKQLYGTKVRGTKADNNILQRIYKSIEERGGEFAIRGTPYEPSTQN